MIYLSSTTDSSGTSRIELTFGPKSAVSTSPIPTVLPYYLRGHGALCGGRPYPYASALCFNPQACTEGIRAAEGSSGPLRPFLLWFERVFFRFRDMIVPVVGHSLGRLLRYIIVYILIVAGLAFIFLRMPTSYLPNEDQGVLLLEVIHPSGSTLEQAEDILDQVSDYFLTNEKEGVESFGWAAGVSLAGMGQNMCIGFVKLKD